MARFNRLVLVGALLLTMTTGSAALGSVVVYTLPDIGTWTSNTDGDLTKTYTGDGFLTSDLQYGFGHWLGVVANQASSSLQVDVTGLLGTTINSAQLSFDLKHGSGGSQQATLTSFDANGTLGFVFNTPASLYTQTETVTGLAHNVIDVTSALSQRLATNDNWFGLHLQGSGQYMWTWSHSSTGYTADEPQLRLTVDYDPAAVGPEPASVAIWSLLGASALVAHRRSRKKS